MATNEDKLKDVAASLNKQFPDIEILPVGANLADPASVSALFEKVKTKYGHADVLVHNAGVFNAAGPVKDSDQQEWWDDMVQHFSFSCLYFKTLKTPSRRSTSAGLFSSPRTSSNSSPPLIRLRESSA